MPDSAGRQIDTREELIAALCEAAELEHNLLVQYLFAAMSVRPAPLSATTGSLPGYHEWRAHEVVRRIQSDLYVICREEMAHLGTVSNLLSAIGAPAHFMRVPMEDVRSRLLTPAPCGVRQGRIKFSLERFSIDAVGRFRDFETPEGPCAPKAPAKLNARAAPDSLDYGTIGSLYALIAEGFQILSSRLGPRLFAGGSSTQDRWSWDAGLRLQGVTDLRSALAAIEFVVTEGEGSRGDQKRAGVSGRSHLQRLNRMEKTLDRWQASIDLANHVWPVVSNPATAPARRNQPNVTMLDPGPDPLKVSPEFGAAELFNGVYTCMLHMLSQFYNPATESNEQRALIGRSTKQVMSGILRPIGELLMSMPATGHAGLHAGPPYEIYGNLALPARTIDRWLLLSERVSHLAFVSGELAKSGKDWARLHFIGDNLNHLLANIDRARPTP